MVWSVLTLFRLFRQELFIVTGAVLTFLIFVPLFTYFYFASDLKTKESIMNRNSTGIVLLDRTGQPFFHFYEGKYSKYVRLSEIPSHVKDSIIAAEDKHFYSHPGFSVPSMMAALLANIKRRDLVYGASTITQQLVKNSLLKPRKSFLRKFQELILSFEVERRYSKNEILEMYLNSVYFGEGAFGIEAAAQTYFGKQAKNLSVAESALLAGIITAPSRYSPLSGDIQGGQRRQQYVLFQLVKQKKITPTQAKNASYETLQFHNQQQSLSLLAPHFALMVKDELIKKYGEKKVARSGFIIHTTIDLTWQKIANTVVTEQVEKLGPLGATNASAVVIDPKTGEVRVLVGSKDWNDPKDGKVNMAISPRQPGSSFKPIVYALAFEERVITPATVLQDVKKTFPGNYSPKDYDGRFRGPVLVRRALANSLNVPAVEVLQRVGIENMLEEAKRLGITTLGDPSNYGLSLVLGTGMVRLTELTNVYATFANEGRYNPVTLITRIEDKQGRIIYRYKPRPVQVIEPEVAFLISSILSDNQARAEEFGNLLTISRPAAVKTGTTEDYKDALTLGYTPQIVVGVWVGNNDNRPMAQIAGSLGAAPIWKGLMETFLKEAPKAKFVIPGGVSRLPICRINGYFLRSASTSAGMEYFIEGTGPTRSCGVTSSVKTTAINQMPTPIAP